MWPKHIKRLFDLAAAIALLVVLAPVLLLIALLVWFSMGRPVLFRQERAGLRDRFFRIMKFRTMRSGEGSDELRLTAFGRFLRATSLDELPELVNVLRGDMSFVGPRPLLTSYVSRYSPTQRRRHEVRPGITGWAQVNGRNAIDWPRKFELDVWYVDHQSFLLDMKVLALTVVRMVRRDHITHEGAATMPEFMGEGKN